MADIDKNTIYTQSLMEYRRYRDYELTAAGWFTGLQIAFITAVSHIPDHLLCPLRTDLIATILFAFTASCLLSAAHVLCVMRKEGSGN
jgi:hypothetical protein